MGICILNYFVSNKIFALLNTSKRIENFHAFLISEKRKIHISSRAKSVIKTIKKYYIRQSFLEVLF